MIWSMKAAGRHGVAIVAAESLYLIYKHEQERETDRNRNRDRQTKHLWNGIGFENLQAHPNDVLPPTKHLVIFPSQFQN